MSDDLRQPAADDGIDGLDDVAAAPHRSEKCDVVAIVEGRGIDRRDRSRRQAGRAATRDNDRPQTACVPQEDPFDGAPADDRRREGHVAALVQGGNRVTTEAGKDAAARDGITFGHNAHRAALRCEEERLAGR